ncbi:MAG: DUF4404 family protein [Elusimicrobia bacterium]|nr:DUF4404 family protein [Elusimicrobiota bacterium]
MLEDTIRRIEETIKAGGLDAKRQAELLALLAALKSELQGLERTSRDSARSIAGLAGVAAHEALRREKPEGLLSHSIRGLSLSVEGLEASHPRLVDTVNSLCLMLSNMGI